MNTSSLLFERITTCSLAIRYLQGNEDYVSSYEEVMKLLAGNKITQHRNTNLIRASIDYLKLGFIDRDTPVRKVKMAMCVALSIAAEQKEGGLSQAVCERFRGINDFDRNVMTRIFSFSICNERVLALLDNAMILKAKNIHPAIDHEFRVEFIELFFNIMESLVRRGDTLADLGFSSHITLSQMESARGIMEKHVSPMATTCWPCFNLEALKKPRGQNTLFPARGALPRVSIGREHVDYDQATADTLKDSLLEKEERHAFLEIISAMVSHASNEPAVTYGNLKLESAKEFFLQTILGKVQADEMLKSISEMAEASKFREERDSWKQKCMVIGAKLSSAVCAISSLEDKNGEMAHDMKRMKEAMLNYKGELESNREFCKMYHRDKKSRQSFDFLKNLKNN